jgi:hypothetical protein
VPTTPGVVASLTAVDMDSLTMEHNLTNHPPSEAVAKKMESLRVIAKQLGQEIIEACPDSRECSLALTNLEQTVMWSMAALARYQ